jgi:hypothetical protein
MRKTSRRPRKNTPLTLYACNTQYNEVSTNEVRKSYRIRNEQVSEEKDGSASTQKGILLFFFAHLLLRHSA